MRFELDENLPAEAADRLRQHGYDAASVRRELPHGEDASQDHAFRNDAFRNERIKLHRQSFAQERPVPVAAFMVRTTDGRPSGRVVGKDAHERQAKAGGRDASIRVGARDSRSRPGQRYPVRTANQRRGQALRWESLALCGR